MQKRIRLLESITYINKMRELIALGDRINIKARLIHLERIILEDFDSLDKEIAEQGGQRMSAKKWLQSKYPYMMNHWNENEHIDDNWIAKQMEQYHREQIREEYSPEKREAFIQAIFNDKLREELVKFVESFEEKATGDIEGVDSIDADQYLMKWIPCEKDIDESLKTK